MPVPHVTTAMEQAVLGLLADHQPRSTSAIADALRVDRLGVRDALVSLRNRGRIAVVGTDASAHRRWGGRQPATIWRLAASG